MKRAAVMLAALGLAVAGLAQQSVLDTSHNLSVTGPNPQIHAASETEVCKFCHTPHNASTQAPLWNRSDPGGSYTMYWEPTMNAYPSQAAAPQPNGASKLCLSCHDGTIALGATVSGGTIQMSGGITTMPVSSGAYFGTDLSGHHPISFTVTDALVAANNSAGDVPLKTVAEMRSGPVVSLDPSDRVQCTSCHDPHHDPFGGFLRAPSEDQVCLGCHF